MVWLFRRLPSMIAVISAFSDTLVVPAENMDARAAPLSDTEKNQPLPKLAGGVHEANATGAPPVVGAAAKNPGVVSESPASGVT